MFPRSAARFLGPVVLAGTVLTLLPLGAPAQMAPTPSPTAPGARAKPLTLADVLTAHPPTLGVALAVGADGMPLPNGASPPSQEASLGQVADAFERLVQHFGDVTAVAPPTMVVLNSPPAAPNIYDGMPPEDAFKLLCGTLTVAQWQALTGARGLAASDLTTDDQRALFAAMFPGGKLKAQAMTPFVVGQPYHPEERDLTQDLPQARLRLSRRVMIMLPVQDNPGMHMGTNLMEQDGNKGYVILNNGYGNSDTLYGAQVRQEVPNAPKHGQLDLLAPAMQVPVPLAGLKTVGDLVYRIGGVTHVQIYPDVHYEKRTLTLVGPATEAPASDLLRAVALCVTGTYRQVGPAFVLTDDLAGVGTRRQVWREFEQQADALRQKPLGEAGDKIVTEHAFTDLDNVGDKLAITPQQKPPAKDDANFNWNFGESVDLTLDKLTPAQQEIARQTKESLDKMNQNQLGQPERHTPTLDGTISLTSEARLQILVPSLDSPIDMQQVGMYNLFQPSSKLQNARYEAWRKTHEQAQKAQPASAVTPQPPPPSLAEVLKPIPRRAVLARPQTPAEVDALVASMRSLGFNQLWLPVFWEGKAHPDLLTAALKAAKGTGIAVFPVFDLLQWGTDAPPDARDLSVLGETSAQADLRRRQRDMLRSDSDNAAPLPAPKTLYVSPFAPVVRQTLTAAVQDMASQPGVAGLVWRAAVGPGYDPPGKNNYYSDDPSLGYTTSARLAFLRTAHTDPVDIGGSSVRANTGLPNFDDYSLEDGLDRQWRQFRADGDLSLLRALRTAAGGAARPLRLLVRSQGSDYDGWYGTWDAPTRPLPVFRQSWQADDGPPGDSITQAKTQSRLSYAQVHDWSGMDPKALAGQITETFKNKPWDGFVLDTTNGAEPGKNPLASLAAGPVKAARP